MVLLLTLKISIQLLSTKWSAHVLWEKRRIYNVVSIVATAFDVKIKALKKVFVAIANFLFIAKDNPYEICLCHHYIPFDYPNLKERFTYNISRIKSEWKYFKNNSIWVHLNNISLNSYNNSDKELCLETLCKWFYHQHIPSLSTQTVLHILLLYFL